MFMMELTDNRSAGWRCAVMLATVSHFSDAVTTSLTGGILRVRDLDCAGAGFFHGFPVQPGAKLKRLFVLPPF